MNTSIQGYRYVYRDTKIQGYKDTIMLRGYMRYKNIRLQGYKIQNAKIQRYKVTRLHGIQRHLDSRKPG